MTKRTLAWLLFVLAVSPFTAPFSTCDLITLFGHATGINLSHSVVQVAAIQRFRTGSDDDALTVAMFSPPRVWMKSQATLPDEPQAASSSKTHSDTASLWVLHPMRLPDRQPAVSAILRL